MDKPGEAVKWFSTVLYEMFYLGGISKWEAEKAMERYAHFIKLIEVQTQLESFISNSDNLDEIYVNLVKDNAKYCNSWTVINNMPLTISLLLNLVFQ